MMTRSRKHPSLLATVILSLLLVAPHVFAQQGDKPTEPSASDAAKPLPTLQPQPTTVPGRPDIPNAEVAKQLRNVAPLPFGAPEDKLPVSQLKLPKGFRPGPRHLFRIGSCASVSISR